MNVRVNNIVKGHGLVPSPQLTSLVEAVYRLAINDACGVLTETAEDFDQIAIRLGRQRTRSEADRRSQASLEDKSALLRGQIGHIQKCQI